MRCENHNFSELFWNTLSVRFHIPHVRSHMALLTSIIVINLFTEFPGNRQNQLSVCLHFMSRTSGHMKIILEDTIQSKNMHTKCKERLPPK